MAKISISLMQIMQIPIMMGFQMVEKYSTFLGLGNLPPILWTTTRMMTANQMVGRCRYFLSSIIQIPIVSGYPPRIGYLLVVQVW